MTAGHARHIKEKKYLPDTLMIDYTPALEMARKKVTPGARITMDDIAREAGVSRQTVSEVLNNKKTFASEATREKVHAIAKKLNYQPNYFAQTLKKGRTDIIGVASGDKLLWGIRHPYTVSVYDGIADFFQRTDYKFLFHHYHGEAGTDQSLELARTRIVDGMIYIVSSERIPRFLETQVPLLLELGIPLVMVHSTQDKYGFDAVGLNGARGGQIVAGHLLEHGYDTIGCVRPAWRNTFIENVIEGFTGFLKARGFAYTGRFEFEYQGNGAEDGEKLAHRLLEDKTPLPRSLFVSHDAIAYGMMKRFARAGIRVPDDLAVIGFGDLIPQRFITTDLTTLDQPGYEKGKKAGQLLVERLQGTAGPEPRNLLLDPPLVVRKSCGCG